MQPSAVNTIRQKNPNEWQTGKEPMTGRQRWFLEQLSNKLGEEVNQKLSKAEASQLIDTFRARLSATKDQPAKSGVAS